MVIIIVLLCLVIAWFYSQAPNIENFMELPMQGPLYSTIHIRLGNCRDKKDFASFKQPSYHGEHGCTQVPCPHKKYPDSFVCWRCCNYH